ncbi:MAG: hypothetical protein FJW88_12080 [Actinobacteria bacterium]|nr:hypothetical protein [Actinomycetota bacterium]
MHVRPAERRPAPLDLPVIDLTQAGAARTRGTRAYEDAFAHLGFGLGTVPRRRERDDPIWARPPALVAAVGLLLLVLLAASA